MAEKRHKDGRPAVGRLARFNLVATVVLAVSATVVVALAGIIGYSLVLVTAERNIETRLEALTRSLRGFGDRLSDTEQRELIRLATTGYSDFPAFVQTYRPTQKEMTLPAETRKQLEVRLSMPVTAVEGARIQTWIEQGPSRYERWRLYHDAQGRKLAVRVNYLAPAAKSWMDRRVGLLSGGNGVLVSWLPRLKASTPALSRLLHDRGLPGKWDALSFTGIHRSEEHRFHITVNNTKVQGDTIVDAVPIETGNLLLVAVSDRRTLGGVLHYTRYVGAGTLAVMVIIWAAAVAWMRGTKRQAHLALQQSNFVAAVSHELRTPLTAIRGAAEMLAHDMVPEAKKAGYYQSILTESDRLRRMVEQILDFDRLQRGRLDVTVQPTDMTAVVQRVADMMQPVAAKRDVQLDVVPAEALTIQGDPDTMAQALTNLIDNAIKFSPRGAEVRIELQKREATALLAVEDSGPGVPAAERNRIFDAFYRVGDESTRKTKGSGLGLYLVQRYVEAVGGTIRVTDAQGGGARFEVELPLV
jgi:signal transduction histidine kinase